MTKLATKFSAEGGSASGWKETEIGTIPEEWEVVNLGDAVEIIDGDRGKNYPNGDDFSAGGYCLFLNTKNVSEDVFDFSNLQFINLGFKLLTQRAG